MAVSRLIKPIIHRVRYKRGTPARCREDPESAVTRRASRAESNSQREEAKGSSISRERKNSTRIRGLTKVNRFPARILRCIPAEEGLINRGPLEFYSLDYVRVIVAPQE